MRVRGSELVRNVLIEPFFEQVRRAAQTIAIRSREGELSYADLAEKVKSFAAALDDLAIGPDDVVALAAERSSETIALILAIVANGAAYLPLDPNYPDERLAAMIEDAQPLLVVGDAPLCARLPQGSVHVVRNTLAGDGAGWHVKRSGTLAYVLFTSGSTGRPKGVAMRTSAVAGLLDWQNAHPRLGAVARTLQFAPLGFDVSFQEIFSTLRSGGTLILPSAAERRDPWALFDLLRREQVERVYLPYVSLQALADAAGDASAALVLKDVVTAGEQLRITPAIRTFFAALPNCVLHNQYGPTEAHVVTAYELRGAVANWPELPPIGKALPHVRTRLVRTNDEVDHEGELLLGGDCLAAGYVGQPALTVARFVEIDGERWYRTGDRVRCNAQGEFEYLGRSDEQIKIAGHRIEPAEIESVLCRHPAVAQAAVVAEERRSGKRLVAHIVAHAAGGDDAIEKALASHCAAMLPEYLRPQVFRMHVALPTTASGKIDRLGLARTQEQSLAWDETKSLREQLIELWQNLLGIEELYEGANVFELGARSLDVVQALTELRRHGHALSVAQIYEQPTIRAQLQLLSAPEQTPTVTVMRAQQQRAALQRLAAAGASR